MQHEQPILAASKPESFSLYISIPFCPTRCAYCSFVAQSTEKTGKLIPQYVDLLCKELEYTAEVAKACNLRLKPCIWEWNSHHVKCTAAGTNH
ncbi:MAG: hypothetical protein ACLSCV_04595 [Acutalibacteraceae bacterium]